MEDTSDYELTEDQKKAILQLQQLKQEMEGMQRKIPFYSNITTPLIRLLTYKLAR